MRSEVNFDLDAAAIAKQDRAIGMVIMIEIRSNQ
jgi:hypothetical protein